MGDATAGKILDVQSVNPARLIDGIAHYLTQFVFERIDLGIVSEKRMTPEVFRFAESGKKSLAAAAAAAAAGRTDSLHDAFHVGHFVVLTSHQRCQRYLQFNTFLPASFFITMHQQDS